MLQLGPILGFKGCTPTEWKVSVLIVTAEGTATNVKLTTTQKAIVSAPTQLDLHGASKVWLYEISVTRPDSGELEVLYEVKDQKFSFFVPGTKMKLQMAYASCNGYSDVSVEKQLPKNADQLSHWETLRKKHNSDAERSPKSHFHLLLMGGDQIYGDSVLLINELKEWSDLDRDERKKYEVSDALKTAIKRHYFEEIYLRRWAKQPMSTVLASIPSLMMWDDHDVIDGWGSLDPREAGSHVYKAFYEVARHYFRVFQLRLPSDDAIKPVGHFGSNKSLGSFQKIDSVGILTLDLRSERTQEQILSKTTWTALTRTLEVDAVAGTNKISHLLVKSSIPVVYPSFDWLEKLMGWMPGTQDLEDDLRDHWRSLPHRGERRRLILNLLAFANRASCRVTLLSGDVHVPALGMLKSTRVDHGLGRAAVIYQLISSGIVHPSAGAMVTFALDKMLTSFEEEVEQGITTEMLEMPDTGRKLLPQRNWLALEFDESDALWAKWWLEGQTHPVVKVIHKV